VFGSFRSAGRRETDTGLRPGAAHRFRALRPLAQRGRTVSNFPLSVPTLLINLTLRPLSQSGSSLPLLVLTLWRSLFEIVWIICDKSTRFLAQDTCTGGCVILDASVIDALLFA
jgi:hypothetical protein